MEGVPNNGVPPCLGPGQDEIPLAGMGYPLPGMGYLPLAGIGYAWTGYSMGGMPLAVSRRTFLFQMFSIFIHVVNLSWLVFLLIFGS